MPLQSHWHNIRMASPTTSDQTSTLCSVLLLLLSLVPIWSRQAKWPGQTFSHFAKQCSLSSSCSFNTHCGLFFLCTNWFGCFLEIMWRLSIHKVPSERELLGLTAPYSITCWGAPSTSTVFWGTNQESSSCGYQKGVFKASRHDLFMYRKGKNNPKSIGGRLQSTVRNVLDDITWSCHGRANTIQVTYFRWACSGRCAVPALSATQRKVRPARQTAAAELLKWSKSKAWRGQEALLVLRGNVS